MHISFSRYLKGTCSLGYLHNTFWIKVKQIKEKKLSNSTSMALSLIENAFYTRERLLERAINELTLRTMEHLLRESLKSRWRNELFSVVILLLSY